MRTTNKLLNICVHACVYTYHVYMKKKLNRHVLLMACYHKETLMLPWSCVSARSRNPTGMKPAELPGLSRQWIQDWKQDILEVSTPIEETFNNHPKAFNNQLGLCWVGDHAELLSRKLPWVVLQQSQSTWCRLKCVVLWWAMGSWQKV